MSALLLRVEGANFDSFLGDTNDLSPIRGASFALLDAIRELIGWLKPLGAKPLQLGASVGIWRLPGNTDGKQLLAEVRRELSSRAPAVPAEDPESALEVTPYATMLADTVPCVDPGSADALHGALEALTARIRWRQMRQPTVLASRAQSPDDAPETNVTLRICEETLVRPAMKKRKRYKGAKRSVSESVWVRRCFGVRKKREFYEQELRATGGSLPSRVTNVARDTRQLANGEEDVKSDLPRQLVGKMAVIAADANRLGALCDGAVRAPSTDGFAKLSVPERYRRLDDRLHELRRLQLAAIVEGLDRHRWSRGTYTQEEAGELNRMGVARRGGGKFAEGNPYLRIETLYWAGDDAVWFVPASVAFALVRQLARATEGFPIDGQRVRYAFGLVLCHHNAPIAPVVDLARELQDVAKQAGRDRDLVAWRVLESFDHIGGDLEAWYRDHITFPASATDFVLPVAELRRIFREMKTLDGGLPRRRLKHLALAAAREGCGQRLAELEAKLATDLPPEIPEALDRLRPALGHGPRFWLGLDELWDYLVAASRGGGMP